MSPQQSTPHHPALRLGRRVIHQLRAALERDTGLQAAGYLQEAGFAGGEELFREFGDWLVGTIGVEHAGDLDVQFLSEVLAHFFREQGWGALTATRLGPAVLALDRLSDGLVAVMEVECRSRGDARCRFLAGAPESLSALYDRMAQGSGYADALGLTADSSAA
jgi:hypothetical protein